MRKYPKVHRLGKDEVEGILDGPVRVEEKIDGANARFWIDVDTGELCFGSRNNQIFEGFNGFVDYVREREADIRTLLTPGAIVYGEWLVKHTLPYNQDAYKNFYLFDIWTPEHGYLSDVSELDRGAETFRMKRPQTFETGRFVMREELEKYVGQSCIGERGEGVVIKRVDRWTNKYGDVDTWAKIVVPEFKEIQKTDKHKNSGDYWEQKFVEEYITEARVAKVAQKIASEVGELGLGHTSRVANSVYHDALTEEIWAFQKKGPTVNLKTLARLSVKKAAQLFKEALEK